MSFETETWMYIENLNDASVVECYEVCNEDTLCDIRNSIFSFIALGFAKPDDSDKINYALKKIEVFLCPGRATNKKAMEKWNDIPMFLNR